MTKTTPLALAALILAFASAARAQVARKPVPADDRITDATSEFDDSRYPRDPLIQMTFWGFNGAKTDESADQDRLCDMDVAELSSNMRYAAKRVGARDADVAVLKTIVASKVERCDDRETPKGSYAPPPACVTQTIRHCAAILSVDKLSLRVQYKSIAKDGTDKACRDALLVEMTKDPARAVIDSAIVPTYGPGGKTGCALKVLELVKVF